MGFNFEKLDVYRESLDMANEIYECIPILEMALRQKYIDKEKCQMLYKRALKKSILPSLRATEGSEAISKKGLLRLFASPLLGLATPRNDNISAISTTS